jgi:hypothetical protein
MSSKWLLLLLFVICFTGAESGNILPQSRIEVSVKGRYNTQLWNYFGHMRSAPGALDSSIGQTLISLLPKIYRRAGQQMVNSWGKSAKGSASEAARVVSVGSIRAGKLGVTIAYTFFSPKEGFGEKYYDERLAFLILDSTASTLMMIPNDKPCAACSELTHIGVVSDTLKIDDKPAMQIDFQKVNNNPCCRPADGSLREEVTTKFFTLEPNDLRERLSFVEKVAETLHSHDGGADSTSTRRAEITMERDPAGNIIRIVSIMHIDKPQDAKEQQIDAYVWNRKSKRFELTPQ